MNKIIEEYKRRIWDRWKYFIEWQLEKKLSYLYMRSFCVNETIGRPVFWVDKFVLKPLRPFLFRSLSKIAYYRLTWYKN